MKQIIWMMLLSTCITAQAQSGSAELLAGQNHLHYLHNISQRFSPVSKLGWQHIATIQKRYAPEKGKAGQSDEIMNQGYVTYAINSTIMFKGGLFYTQATGYRPSAGVQFFFRKKDWMLLLSPRMDIGSPASYEMFVVSELTAPLAGQWKWYGRVQAMSNTGASHHNRSYQLVRAGVQKGNYQLGAGVTFDEYGKSSKAHINSGVFIRVKW